MRSLAAFTVLVLPTFLLAQEKARFGVPLDLKQYPQDSPQQALASALHAVETSHVDYLVAHLADPAFVDERVQKLYGGKFAEQVADTTARLDPSAVKLLKRLAKEGEWMVADGTARLAAKAVPDRSVYLKKIADRWYLEHRQSP